MHLHWRCKHKPVYVTAGFQRSGTTAMMEALEAGGMIADRAPEGDPSRQYYELSHAQKNHGWYSEIGPGTEELPIGERFPINHRGHVIKCLTGSAKYLDKQPNGIKVVFMRRAYEEISESSNRFRGMPFNATNVEKSVAKELIQWQQRPDVELIEVWYDRLVREPRWVFEMLKEHGWPINPKKAARIIDPEKRHVQPVNQQVLV